MPSRGLIDPKWTTALKPQFFPDRCTIQEATITRNDFGGEVETWANLEDHFEIPCAVGTAASREYRRETSTHLASERRIALDGYYPAIDEEMRAVVGDDIYDILIAEHGSQPNFTVLYVELVR